MRMIQIVSACMLLAACKAPKPEVVFHHPPQVVVASFESFADSLMPDLSHALDAAGYHPGWYDSDSLLLHEFDVDVSMWSGDDSTSYQAVISVDSHDHMYGLEMSAKIWLEFVTVGTERPWALLTSDGYLYDPSDTDFRSDLPLDVQVAIRNVFKDQVDIREWVAYVQPRGI